MESIDVHLEVLLFRKSLVAHGASKIFRVYKVKRDMAGWLACGKKGDTNHAHSGVP